MKKATLITHQGWADHFSCNGIVNHYSSLFDELVLFAADKQIADMLSAVYCDSANIKVIVPKFSHYSSASSRGSTCVKCHTHGSPFFCPRGIGLCEYVDYSEYSDFENIKIGAFKGYVEWEKYLQKSQKSFSHCFYSYEGLSPDLRVDKFKVSGVKQLEHPSQSYSVIHDDRARGIVIEEKSNDNVIQLNQISKVMIDTIKILENSSEIRMIDSNYSVLVYFLSFHNQKIASIPKYLHASARKFRDISIYIDPIPEAWSVL